LAYVERIHNWVVATEHTFEPDPNYLALQKKFSSVERETLINWLLDVQVKFNLLPETFFITVNIIDRYLSKRSVTLSKLQLLGITAMMIACKFQEIYPPITSDFIHITDKAFTARAVKAMEKKVLHVIEFDVNCTPSQTFLENYCRAIDLDEPRVLIYASFLLDLALIKAEFLQFKTSQLTVCALVMALRHQMQVTNRSYIDKLQHLEEVMELE